MITPSDADYQETKRLKKSGASLKPPFKELAEWIAAEYRVRVLNVVHDAATYERPRLNVILDTEADASKFQNGLHGNYNQQHQERVQERFAAILESRKDARFRVAGLFVIFSAFERIARTEANESVTKEDLQRLKRELNNEDLWEISRLFAGVTFFFYTDAQVKKYEAAGLRPRYARQYAAVLQAYDEFGYFQTRGVSANFDSKENFDNHYQSNWYYYYK